jgi:hypothetical protein
VSPERLDIAGARITLSGHLPRERIRTRYGAFAAGSGSGGWLLDLRRGPVAYGAITGRVVRRGEERVLEGLEAAGWIDPAARRGEVLADAVDLLLRAAVNFDVLSRGGCLFHAAAVAVQGRAHLFPGRSGAGKSTLASLARVPLGDELCAVVPGPGGLRVYGTPWWSGRPGSAPLAGVYALAWDGEGVAPLPRRQGLRHLLANITLVADEPATRAAAFAAAGRIAAAVPFGRFSFGRASDVDALLGREKRAA